MRWAVAQREDLPLDLAIRFAEDTSRDVRAAVAHRPDLPDDVVVRLAGDSEWNVREKVAERASLPDEAVLRLASRDTLYLATMLEPGSASPEAAEKLAADGDPEVRGTVAGRADLSPATFVKLAKDRKLGVVWAVASNPACPPEALETAMRRILRDDQRRDERAKEDTEIWPDCTIRWGEPAVAHKHGYNFSYTRWDSAEHVPVVKRGNWIYFCGMKKYIHGGSLEVTRHDLPPELPPAPQAVPPPSAQLQMW